MPTHFGERAANGGGGGGRGRAVLDGKDLARGRHSTFGSGEWGANHLNACYSDRLPILYDALQKLTRFV